MDQLDDLSEAGKLVHLVLEHFKGQLELVDVLVEGEHLIFAAILYRR